MNKIRGNVVGTTQKPEIALLAATNLTEEQKAKVRANIGATSNALIGDVIKEYLENNPMDTPVLSVNGKTGVVMLTAADIGALAESELRAAVDNALAQAKASGEFDGYTPQKGVDYFDGKDGEDGKDYVLTEADKTEIAQQAAALVDTALLDAIGTGEVTV